MAIREYLSLDGLWRYVADLCADGGALGFWKREYDSSLWREVSVPSCFEAGLAGFEFYSGTCWYRRRFRVLENWRARRVVLRFEAVNYRARVWLNGVFLGENQDGFLPFEYEAQKALDWAADNILAVAVDNSHHAGDVPGMHTGWRGYGGILREVGISATDHLYMENLRINAEPCDGGGRIECRLRIKNSGNAVAAGDVDVAVFEEGNDKALAKLGPYAINAGAGDVVETVMAGMVPGARSWSPADPVLHRAVATLRGEGGVFDEVQVRFGFRRVQTTPEGLLLNGERIFLTGFNRHEDSPVTAMATDLRTTRRDLEQMKEAGCNFLRLCHYPHHPAELDMCDELGLLAFCEIPLYFWNDRAEGKATQKARAAAATRQLERMIARDGNHPSVIFWSVSNETDEDADPAVAESNRALIRRARELDPARLCVHVSNHWIDHPNFAEDDVICINHYPSLEFKQRSAGQGPDLKSAAERWRRELEALHKKHPGKPVLVTEFGYCSFAGTYGPVFGEDVHAQVLETEFAAIQQPFVCGAAVWCWADHPWPPGRFMDGLPISPYGVLTRARRKLKPYWTARAMFRTRQGVVSAPVSPGANDKNIIMVRPTLNDIPQFSFPEGYGIRPMMREDIGLWTDIERDAEQFLKIGDTTFMDEYGDDLEAIRWRCYIVTDPRGLGIGTISAWYNRDFRGRDYGRIHWVAIRPAFQGKGLGRAALSFALNRLAQWHDRCYLVTSTARVGAVHLYLQFGFEPDLSSANAVAKWRTLSEKLKHPLLERALTVFCGSAQ